MVVVGIIPMSVASLRGHVKAMVASFGFNEKSKGVQDSMVTTMSTFVNGKTFDHNTVEPVRLLWILSLASKMLSGPF